MTCLPAHAQGHRETKGALAAAQRDGRRGISAQAAGAAESQGEHTACGEEHPAARLNIRPALPAQPPLGRLCFAFLHRNTKLVSAIRFFHSLGLWRSKKGLQSLSVASGLAFDKLRT